MTQITRRRRVSKVAISIRLRRETLNAYRNTGKGWLTRMSDDLDRLALRRQKAAR